MKTIFACLSCCALLASTAAAEIFTNYSFTSLNEPMPFFTQYASLDKINGTTFWHPSEANKIGIVEFQFPIKGKILTGSLFTVSKSFNDGDPNNITAPIDPLAYVQIDVSPDDSSWSTVNTSDITQLIGGNASGHVYVRARLYTSIDNDAAEFLPTMDRNLNPTLLLRVLSVPEANSFILSLISAPFFTLIFRQRINSRPE
jgi:hypothetical protein